ncbi:MAG TPA: M48 family metallopeptidase [Actinomycetota bacterium]|nr:M48 family metallopeptidase [Actinomycetota bacterium]
MSTTKAAALVAVVAVASAAVVALASRAPASLRRAEPGDGATDPSLGASFSDEQVARHGAYRGPSYLALGLSVAVEATVLVVLARGPMARAVAALERLPGGVVVHAALAGVLVALVLALAAVPLGFVRGFVVERAWGLSTQDLAGWLSDRARGAAVGAVVSAIAAVAFFAVARAWPRAWWIVGWVAFSALTALLVYLAPVVVAPLFNRFTPLEQGPLRARVVALARDAGVDVGDVLVADASRRTTAENAYVAGLWGTKRMVLYDTLVDAGDRRETEFVVAHELGHAAENHVAKNVAAASATLLVAFGALGWLATRRGPWAWAGASGVADLRAIPVLLLFALAGTLLAMPLENWVSRRFEARADTIAIELTGDPDTAVRVFRRLAFANLADLRPPPAAVWALYTHPPIPDRIRAATSPR